MFRSLHMKLVLVLVLLVISVMAVVGTFLINSVTTGQIDDFSSQMALTFTPEFIIGLEKSARQDSDGVTVIKAKLEAFASQLGIGENRMFYILSSQGNYLAGSDDAYGKQMTVTPNILTAMNGEVGQDVQKLGGYFDIAVPVRGGNGQLLYITGVLDNKTELRDLTWNLVTILVRGMLFGLLVAIMLSFLLSKTITTPVERLTDQASRIAGGEFGQKAEVYSTDEIGILTQTFNEMAEVMENTLLEVEGERNKLDTLFKHMADGVVAFDAGGDLLHKNPAAERMLGKKLSLTQKYGDIFPNIHLDEYNLEDENNFIEIDYSANKRILKILFAPIKVGDDARGIMAVLHDITEQRKLDESRREFVANVSHELRTPLTNIRSYTETMIEDDTIDKETQHRFLQVVYDEADRMARIVKDLLTLSRLDSNRMEMSKSEVDVCALTRAAALAMEMDAKSRGIEIIDALPERLEPVYCDRQRIEQVIVNIISNAVKYNRPDGSITINGYNEQGYVALKITDTGIGVPKEDVPRVFERFYRVDKARSREHGGTGLGLAIAREIIEEHGGTIDFDSEYGIGSAVTISIPTKGKAQNA